MTDRCASPLVSVVIPTRNRVKYLERSLLSVFAAIERYPNTELIVIDGASTDGAVEILKKHDSRISYWVSEPDGGVGEAVKKGFEKSRGEIVLLFGDDDELLPDSIQSMVAYLAAHPEVDAVFGAAVNLWHSTDGRQTPIDIPLPTGRLTLAKLLRVQQDGWPTAELQFSRRRLYERFGSFDTRYRYAGSLDTWCRQVVAGAVLVQIPTIIARRHYSQDSGNVYGRDELVRELLEIVEHFGDKKAVRSLKLALLRQSEPARKLTAGFRSYIWFPILDFTRPLRRVLGIDQRLMRRMGNGQVATDRERLVGEISNEPPC